MSYNNIRTGLRFPKQGAYVKTKQTHRVLQVAKGYEGLPGLFKAMQVPMKSPRQGWSYRAARRNADFQRYKECSPRR